MRVISLPVQRRLQTQQPTVEREEVRSPESRVKNSYSAIRNPQSAINLVGRDAELTHLHTLFAKALHGDRQIVFVSGEAGIGKTTLVDAFLAQIRDRVDIRVTSGQCVEQYGPGEAYMPLLEATMRLCQGPSREQRIEGLKRYAPSWLVQLPGLLDIEDRPLLQQQAQGISRERMLREMAETAELFTIRRGLVLVLEDLHWSDVSTLDWVTYIARRREPAKLLIIGTYRPTDVLASGHPLRGVVQELQSRRQCEELRVTPFSEAAIEAYLYGRFGKLALPEAVTTTLTRRTGGNPLFVVNTADYFVRQGAVTEEAGRWTLQADKVNEVGESIPDTLRQLIERQVERVSEVEQRLLEVASVAGVEFATVDVAAGLSRTVEEVETCCERFVREGQWLRSVGFTESPDGTVSGRYSFLHAMYHEVIYTRLAEIRRIQLHRRIAAHKEAAYGKRTREIAAELAVHFEKGRELLRAVHYLGKAGENALRRSAHLEATSLLTKGLDLLITLPQTPERAQQEFQLTLTLGTSLMVIKGYAAPELEGIFARARELSHQVQETPQIFAVLGGLWTFYVTRAQLQTARELAEQCLAFAEKRQRPTTSLWAHCFMGQTLYALGRLQESRSHLEQSLHFYDPGKHNPRFATSPQDPGETSLTYLARVLWLLGYPEQALVKSKEARTLAQQLGHPYSLAHALSLSASLHHLRSEAPATRKHAEAAIALLKESGSPYRLAQGTILRGWTLTEQGKQDEGIAEILHGLTAWQASGAELWRPYYLSLLAEAHIKANQFDEGWRIITEALQLVGTTEEHVFDAELYRLKGEVTLQRLSVVSCQLSVSDPRPPTPDPQSEAEAYFQKAIAVAREQQAKSLELRAATSLAQLWQHQSKKAEARELLQEMYDWFTEGFNTKDLQEAADLLRSLGGSVERTESKKQMSGRAGERASGRQEENTLLTHSPIHPFTHSSSIAQSPSRPVVFPVPSTSPPAPNIYSDRSSSSDTGHRTPDALFRSEGDYWTVSFAGETCRLKDVRGLHYIAHLLQQPHQEIHVIALLTTGVDLTEELTDASSFQDHGQPFDHAESLSDAGEILDPRARAAYKQRLSELREELAEVQRFHDVGRSEQLTAEIDVLTHELTSAMGLGGRVRHASSPVERARIAVSKAVKKVLKKIHTHHPALGHHLATTIKTGAYCAYTPDPRLPISWQG